MNTLSSGYVVGIVFFGICVLACLGLAAWCWWEEESRWPAVLGVALAVVFAALWYGVNYPAFDMQYHSYETISGEVVQAVNSDEDVEDDTRLFKLKGESRNLSCSDDWCGEVGEGDTVTLSCIRNDQPVGANSWSCKFIDLEEADHG